MPPSSPSKSTACKGPCEHVTSANGFRCGGCGHPTHIACQPGLKPHLKADGSMSKTYSELIVAPFVVLLCQPCTVRADVDRLLSKQPSILADVNSAVNGLSKDVKEIQDNQKKVSATAIEAAFKGIAKEIKEMKQKLDTGLNVTTNDDAVKDLANELKGIKKQLDDRPKTYASVASADIDSIVAKTAKVVAAQTTKISTEVELRSRSIVLDNLAPKPSKTDKEVVEELFNALGVKAAVIDAHRMGRFQAKGDRPLKTKVVLSNIAEHAVLTSANIRATLLEAEFEEQFPRLFIAPSRSSEDRHTLWLLRQRRNELNDQIHSPERNGWILDSVRLRLWKKTNGQVDWTKRDLEWKEWKAAREGQRGGSGGSDGGIVSGANTTTLQPRPPQQQRSTSPSSLSAYGTPPNLHPSSN